MNLLPWETDPSRYEEYFSQKCDRTEQDFRLLGLPPAQRFASPPESFRARAEFRIWHDGDDLMYVMFDPAAPRVPVPVSDFAPALQPIRKLMPELLAALRENPVLRRKLFQAEFMASSTGEALVTLIYHRPLDEDWEGEATALRAQLGISIVGRSRKQKRVLGRDYVVDEFTVAGIGYRYRQYEQSFVQPNAPINGAMLNWAHGQARKSEGDLLELYCGNGNFTLPMATQFGRVLATELAKSGTRAALHNLADNGVENVDVVRLSAEEVSEALAGSREFRRLAALPQALADYDLRSVFVDPPRAGLDAATLDCVRRFDKIFYISCNPDTLLENLRALSSTHRAQAVALFDQFPYSRHIESGVVLQRR